MGSCLDHYPSWGLAQEKMVMAAIAQFNDPPPAELDDAAADLEGGEEEAGEDDDMID